MELPPIIERTIETAKNVGRFVLHRLDGGHGGFAELADVVYPANITILEGAHDEQS